MIVYRLSAVEYDNEPNNRKIINFVWDKEFYKLDRLKAYKDKTELKQGQEWDITFWEVWGSGDYREHDYRGTLNNNTLEDTGH